MVDVGARAIGARVLRAEDPRILTGRGRYIDDVTLPGMLHGAFKRSTVPHGRLVSLDVSAARALPGVVAVYTGEDLARFTNSVQPGAAIGMHLMPGLQAPPVYALATDKVRYVGDPIALVVADDRYVAEDAVELIEEDIDWLDPVVTYEDALDHSKPRLFDELKDNVAFRSEATFGDVDRAFARADRVVHASIWAHRHQPVPMETRGLVASYDVTAKHLTVHASTQSPHMIRVLLPGQVNVPMEKIRVLADDVGGGFGLKNGVQRDEVAVIAASIDLGRPVKWIEDRLEHLAVGGQAREEGADIEAAVTADGLLLGVRMDAKLNLGAYGCDPFNGAIFVGSLSNSFQGPTRVEGIQATNTVVFSNKATYVSYRGPWATADFLRERLLDIVARELDLDPLDVRRRNYVRREEPPLAMLTGQPFLAVTTQEQVEEAARRVDWAGFPERQEAARREGRYLGIGMAAYLEAAPGPKIPGQEDMGAAIMGQEVAHVSLEDDGTVRIVTRQQPHGQSHETTLAQVAVDELGVRFEDVKVVFGDTDITPFALVGTGGSRAATMANGVVLHASRELREKIVALAEDVMEASAADLEINDGVISVKGSPSVQLPLRELARIVSEEPSRLAEGADTGLLVTRDYDGGQSGWSGGAHVAKVEVDIETGLVDVVRYVVVEDCGLPVNPAIVEGQIRGGVAQAIGAVLLEHAAYGEDGQYLASTFMDYLMPTTTNVPNLEIHHIDTILTDPDVNFRGVGEGGMIVAPACLTNAIEDALQPFGVRVQEQHLPPARILELLGTVAS
ncbi:MAG TPA: xanthine dehydrogenase family protein molybdopterin-binding subunit [Acidimicrobiia bacterium]|nr:xanthine dehydrogenase family protein molybdopterin-binding subunit [Acidimicrobiia bacterium]